MTHPIQLPDPPNDDPSPVAWKGHLMPLLWAFAGILLALAVDRAREPAPGQHWAWRWNELVARHAERSLTGMALLFWALWPRPRVPHAGIPGKKREGVL